MKPEDNSLDSSNGASEHDSSLEGGYQAPSIPSQPVKPKRMGGVSLFRFNKVAALIAVSTFLSIILVGGGALIYDKVHHNSSSLNSLEANGTYKDGSVINVKESEPSQLLTVGQVNQLAVNGQLTVNKTIVIAPSTTAPSSASQGEIYYNSSSKEPYFYNGSQFVGFLSTASPQVSSLGGTTGAITLGNGLTLSSGKLSVLPTSSNGGVTSLDSLAGSLSINDSTGSGSTITIQSASTSQAGLAEFSSNDFQVLGNGKIDTIQGISTTSDVQFDSIALDYGGTCTAGGNLCLNSGATIYASNYTNPSTGSNSLLTISSGTGSQSNIQFSDDNGANTFLLPSTGGTGQTFCTTGITCASGGGQAVILGPSGAQDVSSNFTSLYIDKTAGTGNLIDLQTGASQNALVINGSGNATFYNTTTATTLDVTGTLQAETLTPNASLTIGSTSQTFTLQGNSSSELYFVNAGNSSYVGTATPTGNTLTSGSIYYAFDNSAGTSTQASPWFVCTTAGNCVGLGGGVGAPSGSTTNYLPLFTTTEGTGGDIASSIISEPSSSVINVQGILDVSTGDVDGATISVNDIDGATLSGGTLSGGTVSGSTLSSTQLTFTGASGTVTSESGDNLTIDTGGGTSSLNLGNTHATTINVGNSSSTTNLIGLYSQNYSSGSAATADSDTFTNSNSSSAGVAVQGISITPSNNQTPSSGTNTLNLLSFAAAGTANGASDTTNGINFASTTGYTNFINTPSFVLQSSGNITGAGTYDGATVNGSDIDGATISGGTLSGSTLSSTQLTFTGASGTVTSESGDNLTIDTGGGTSSLNLGNTHATTIQIGSSSLGSGTQTINIGNSNNSGGTTNIVIGTGSSSNGTLTLQAAGGINVNSSITQTLASGSSSGTIALLTQSATNSNTGAFSTTVNADTITLTGTNNSNVGENTLNGINFSNVVAATHNTFNGLYFGNNYNYIINTVNSDFSLTDAGTLQDTGSVSITGSGATALTVQGAASQTIAAFNNSSSNTVATFTSANSTTGSLNLGNTASVTGNLVFEYSGSGSGTVTITSAVSSSASSYTLVLPTTGPTGSLPSSSSSTNECLQDTSGSSSTVQLAFGNCANQHTKFITLTPEYAGAVLDNDGASNDAGTMTSGYDSTQKENYYEWSTSQSTNQLYSVVVSIPLPAGFAGGASSISGLTINTKTSDIVNGTITGQLYDTSGNLESNWNTCNLTPSTPNTWTTINALSACSISGTYTAGGTITLRLILQSPPSGATQLGNIVLSYTSNF